MATALAELAAVSCFVAGAYGSYTKSDPYPLLAATAFAGGFIFARYRVAGGKAAPLQLLLLLALVCTSFVLHLLYLPAGICCFFTLMLCENELLLPPPTKSASKRE